MLLAVLASLVLGPATAAGATRATAKPERFIPDWDGHTDTTTVTWRLATRSQVTVRVLDSRGRSVRVLARGVRAAGTHSVAWDGRAANGRVMSAGRYRIRVTSTPRPRTARAASQVRAAGTLRTTNAVAAVELAAPDVAVSGVQLSRSALGKSGAAGRTTVRYALTTRASVAAAIVDSKGRSVRTLVAGARPKGVSTVAWNGRDDAGRLVADGSYELLVAATGNGRPTSTTRVPLAVDRAAPTFTAPAKVTARVTASSVTVPIRVTVGEAATVVVRVGRRSASYKASSGTSTLSVAGASLGLAPRTGRRTVTAHVTARDAAGNQITRKVSVVIPAKPVKTAPPKRTPTPTPPPVTTPTPDDHTPPAKGLLPWPTAGIVTSEFGMRNGRMHTGIDIADPTGTPIHPVAAGTVSFVGVLGGYGNLVIVEHPGGLRTYYAHMSKFGGHAVGASVTRTDVLGLVGCTGTCTGPHVHFETRIADVPKDPRGYLIPR